MDFSKIDDILDDDDSNSQPSDEPMSEEAIICEKKDDEEESDEDEEDDEDEDDEANVVSEVNRLQEELSHNPFDYDKHLLLIDKLKSLGELEFLREAREKMNKIYPLSPDLWQEWLTDEISIATTNEQRLNIICLYDRAVAEYLDTKIWLGYAQFSIGLMDLLGIDKIRAILERALLHAGLCVVDGSLIWGICRDFEDTILATYLPVTEQNSEQVNEQVKRIYNIFRRQLAIPLFQMEQSYSEFEEWLSSILETCGIDLKQNKQELANIKVEYNKALKTMELLKDYEQKLLNSPSPHYEQYIKYLDFEIKNDNLARTQCLFERAITENCLQADLWLKYLKFCDKKIVVDKMLIPIYERSVRNCPWVADIWVQYLEAVERLGENNSDLTVLNDNIWSILEQACKNTFSSVDDVKKLRITYLNFIRRKTIKMCGWNDETELKKIRTIFQSSIESIEPDSGLEYCYDLYKYFAKIEAKYCKNIENGRKIWNDLFKQSLTLKLQASFWLDYANFELLFGDEKEYRKILLKGLTFCNDFPESIGDTLLRFEYEDGDSINDLQVSKLRYENAMKRINEKRAKEAKQSTNDKQSTNKTFVNAKLETEADSSLRSKKRKIESNEKSQNTNKPSEPKKKKVIEPLVHGTSVRTDEAKRDQTVFLSNLDFEVNEDEIREVFSKFGNVNDVRLVRNYKGLSKGYCYVEFEKIESVRESLLNDRMMLRGRPVYISEMEKPNKFSYSTSKEKNKLFVKNIPFDVTKEQLLDKVFPEYKDSIVDVRLITYRNGHSKGWAYVEFKNASIAEKAASEKNNFQLGDRELFVAISDPSQSKAPSAFSNSDINSKMRNSASSSLSSTSMMPHALRVKSQPSKVKLQLSDLSAPSTSSNNGDTIVTVPNPKDLKKLNNDQFRSMFLK